ncbi:hypothetical protein ACJMK2_025581 [Sinanodonta woodiana]|uniref:dipeptidyl-peptidase IV n=1 Tax=Sinanodonta woodiana TaxID=1069815 RepID=A0ABD3XH08_SINWO
MFKKAKGARMASEATLDLYESSMSSIQYSNPQGKKSWDDLRQAVRETRKLLPAFASRIPSNFTFRTIQTNYGPMTRIYFLGIPPKNRENTLIYVDVPTQLQEEVGTLPWCNLLDAFPSGAPAGQMSREEQLQRERKRVGIFGITSYDFAESAGRFIFPACNNLYVCDDHNFSSEEPCIPQVVNTGCLGARMDPQICPNNMDLVAFVHCNDVWVTCLSSGQERRLTFSHKGTGQLVTDPLSSGVPSFVIQEEFDRYTGFWWQPADMPRTDPQYCVVKGSWPRTYRLLVEEVDESDVEILHIYSPSSDNVGIDEYRYPRAGSKNAHTFLKMIEFTVDEDGQISDTITEKRLYRPLSFFFPWMEYLVRAGWTPDSKYVYVQLLDRRQRRLALILIPVACFVIENSDIDMTFSEESWKYPALQIIYEDTSDIWINTHDILHFLPSKCDEEVPFIWSSEKSGFRHLYKVTAYTGQSSTSPDVFDLSEGVMKSETTEVPLTRGEWEVSGKQIWVNEEKELIYFLGLKDSPIETHLYMVSIKSPVEPVRLTERKYSHTIFFSSDLSMFVTVFSSIDQFPMSNVYKIQYVGQRVSTQLLGVLMGPSSCKEYHPPELFNYQSIAGHIVHGMYYRPHNQEHGRRYPTVLFVYGGPQVQLVTNSFKGLKFIRLHTLASQGYAVVVIDGRGSCNRGLRFESHIMHRLGLTEIEEQVEGLKWLASNVDFIDLSRVAIHGWSYGGYLSLMGLAQRSDIFKVAIVGAPVVDWALYDTGYTERYMDTPDNNRRGYQCGAVTSYVDNFPDQDNRLLIIHGLIDENVHFQHTSALINALVKACKPYQLQVYPNERHGIRNHEANEHYKTMVLNFLQNNL